MKTTKLFLVFILVTTLFTSCYTDDFVIDNNSGMSLNELLSSQELWYVDINQTLGSGETPFLNIAFTISFRNGVLYANNNLVGFGSQGSGFGIDVGVYDAYNNILDINHDIDGFQSFDVFQIDNNTIELYNPFNDTSYFLNGYQRTNFDYDFVFYDNIHYFLQEYEAWEKTYTSDIGAISEFDQENYLQFLSAGNDSKFKSSKDINISNPNGIYWDYTGIYNVADVSGDMYLKTLTLDYDFFDNEYFELSIINDQSIALFHPSTETIYEFTGRGYIQILRETEASGKDVKFNKALKKRKQKTIKKDNPRVNTRS